LTITAVKNIVRTLETICRSRYNTRMDNPCEVLGRDSLTIVRNTAIVRNTEILNEIFSPPSTGRM
jgi:hypothetical protein